MRDEIRKMPMIVKSLLAILVSFGTPFGLYTAIDESGLRWWAEKSEFDSFVASTNTKMQKFGKRVDRNELDRLSKEYSELVILREKYKDDRKAQGLLNIENRMRSIEERTRTLRNRLSEDYE